jgi:FdrA protein
VQTEEGEKRVAPNTLLSAAPHIINIGLESFAVSLANEGAKVVHVRWSPPAGGNARLASLLTKLRN